MPQPDPKIFTALFILGSVYGLYRLLKGNKK